MRRSTVSIFVVALVVAFATAHGQPSTVILVRHAEKASQSDPDPVLSEAGSQRAIDLAAALADAHVTTMITTQYQRTALTGAAVAGMFHPISIVVPTTGGTATHVANVAAAVRGRPAGDVVLVVGHSNTIPAILGALGGPKIADLCDSQYSMLFILEMSGPASPRLIRAHYGKPDPADPACTTMRAP